MAEELGSTHQVLQKSVWICIDNSDCCSIFLLPRKIQIKHAVTIETLSHCLMLTFMCPTVNCFVCCWLAAECSDLAGEGARYWNLTKEVAKAIYELSCGCGFTTLVAVSNILELQVFLCDKLVHMFSTCSAMRFREAKGEIVSVHHIKVDLWMHVCTMIWTVPETSRGFGMCMSVCSCSCWWRSCFDILKICTAGLCPVKLVAPVFADNIITQLSDCGGWHEDWRCAPVCFRFTEAFKAPFLNF